MRRTGRVRADMGTTPGKNGWGEGDGVVPQT